MILQGHELDVLSMLPAVGIAPLVLGGLGLAGKLIGGFFGHRSQQKQADAERKAQEEKLRRETAAWDVGQNRRVGQLNAVQGLLQRTQPFLHNQVGSPGGTGPDYTFDPEVLKVMQEKTPYPGSLPADPRAGLGSKGLSSLFGGVGDALLSGYASQPVAGSALGGELQGFKGPLDSSMIDPLTGRPKGM